MKILHLVEQYEPSVGGMQEVVKRLSEGLAQLNGTKVTVATQKNPDRNWTSLNGVNVESFSISGNSVRGIKAPPGETERFRKLVCSDEWDVVTVFAAQQWASDLTFEFLESIPAKKVLVPTCFSGLNLPAYTSYFDQMPVWMNSFSSLVFLSEQNRDFKFAEKYGLRTGTVIPNGASECEFSIKRDAGFKKRNSIPGGHKLIIHVGSHTGLKGHEETIDIFLKSGIENCTLLIIGNFFPQRRRKPIKKLKSWSNRVLGSFSGQWLFKPEPCPVFCLEAATILNHNASLKKRNCQILFRTFIRDETIQAYLHADLFLFPSRIECSPIVLFEAMASQTPFLSSEAGNSAEIVQWSNGGGVILPTKEIKNNLTFVKIDESAVILKNLINDPAELLKMGTQGFESWKKSFTWEKIIQSYYQLYKKIQNS